MKNIIVPVDFSRVTPGLISQAASFAREEDGRLVLLHVVASDVLMAPYPLPAEIKNQQVYEEEDRAEARLTRLAVTLRQRGIEVLTMVEEGDPVSAILRVAHRLSARFIVVGSHGHRPLYDLLIGSTARGILQHAECPVLLLPPRVVEATEVDPALVA
jgi:nucleotide-binding universal stress UspA family protein